jgi:hypothetical protein
MTETEWSAATDSRPMLAWLGSGQTVSQRKLRLVAAAIARRAWSLLTRESFRQAVEVAERFADGLAGERALRVVLEEDEVYDWLGGVGDVAHLVVLSATEFDAGKVARLSVEVAAALGEAAYPDAAFDHDSWLGAADIRDAEFEAHARLLRCTCGTQPFGRRLWLSPSLLEWNGGTVVQLAQAAYDNRLLPSGELDPARVAILGDALEEAGCPAEHELLAHLRSPGPHVHGCVAVDAILGKK